MVEKINSFTIQFLNWQATNDEVSPNGIKQTTIQLPLSKSQKAFATGTPNSHFSCSVSITDYIATVSCKNNSNVTKTKPRVTVIIITD